MNNKEPKLRFRFNHHDFSSWDCLIIGKGDKGNSGFKIFEIDGEHILSQNRISYWISGNEKYCGMTIFKDTPEAIKLKKMIDNKVGLVKIERYLTELTFKKLSARRILEFIKSINMVYYEQGCDDTKQEIRKVLGIKEY
jgi:uncharacterized protein (DUF2164 family)